MFDVLVYLYENFGAFTACPDSDALAKKLTDAGFEDEEISDALAWLQGLAHVTRESITVDAERARAFRVYSGFEFARLGAEAIGFLTFLENEGQLAAEQREIVVERALATRESPIPLAKLKVIVLMVLWSLQVDIDTLVLEELLDDGEDRLLH
jgi:Smg protein